MKSLTRTVMAGLVVTMMGAAVCSLAGCSKAETKDKSMEKDKMMMEKDKSMQKDKMMMEKDKTTEKDKMMMMEKDKSMEKDKTMEKEKK